MSKCNKTSCKDCDKEWLNGGCWPKKEFREFKPSGKFLTEKQCKKLTNDIYSKQLRELCLNCGAPKLNHLSLSGECSSNDRIDEKWKIILEKKLKPRINKQLTLKPIVNPKVGDKVFLPYSKFGTIERVKEHVCDILDNDKSTIYCGEPLYGIFNASKITEHTETIILKFKIK